MHDPHILQKVLKHSNASPSDISRERLHGIPESVLQNYGKPLEGLKRCLRGEH
jgi:hypothetical protein